MIQLALASEYASMGIRFNCAHCGRALNVKAAQAGLDAICPSCRQVIRIPDPACVAVGEDVSLVGSPAFEESDDEQITTEGIDPVSRQESEQLDIDPGLADTVSNRTNRRFRTSETQERDDFDLDKPSQNFEKIDPLSDAPDLIWYYRIKDQRERGPLKAKAIQAELAEGRIRPGSLVWREDWHAWLPVEQVFPGLFPDASLAKGPAAEEKRMILAKTLNRLKSNSRDRGLVVLLIGVVLLILIAIAVWLVLNSK